MRMQLLFVAGQILGLGVAARGDAISDKAGAAYATKAASAAFTSLASSPNGADLGWGESYTLMGAVAMYEGTADVTHLQHAMAQADLVLGNRADRINVTDDIRGRVVPAWPSTKYTNGVSYAWEVHAGMVGSPIARAAYLVRKDRNLGATYGAKADQYVRDLTDMAAGFEADWRWDNAKGEGHYNEFYLGGSPSPFNQSNAMGRMYLNLYLATGQERFRERAVEMAKYFKDHLRLAGAGTRYDWSYSPTNAATQSEDLSHAAINADFAFDCYRAGLVFTAADMQKFVGTFLNMSNGSGGWYGSVAGASAGLYSTPGLAGMWGQLGFVDGRVRTEFYKYYQNNSGVGGATWGTTIAGYLVETAKPMTFDAVVSRPSELKVVAAMEAADRYFVSGGLGSLSQGLGAGSGWVRDTVVKQNGGRSVKIAAVDDPTKSGGWVFEVPSVGTGTGLVLDRAGWIGVWLRTATAGVSAGVTVKDIDGMEESVWLPLAGDGQWHLYQWNLDDSGMWDALTGGDGRLEGLMAEVRSIVIKGGDAGAVVWADAMSANVSGMVPEPGLGGLLVVWGAWLIGGRRK